MRISKSKLILFVSLLIFSILVANVANILNTDVSYERAQTQELAKNQNANVEMTASLEPLLWFLQISDIHISIFRDPTRISEFKEFCHYTLSIIKPSVVLASGDLTDAKTHDSIGSQQFVEEWKHYFNTLRDYNVHEKTAWLDIRGNHDNFNVANKGSKQNFYANYSMQGRNHPRSYMHQVRKNNVVYTFMAIDACLEPGPRRPFNFIGQIDAGEANKIDKMIEEAETSGTNYTVWFGHFPTSCILTDYTNGIRALIGKHKQGLVYMCGHLHRLGGIVPNMYTLQQAGFLELELGDWKDNRVFRLVAIDHGLLSFIDVQHRDWPIVLITNPKHALFAIPNRENPDVMRRSTHIRILIFSPAPISTVTVKINGETWRDCTHVNGPLYVAPWDPNYYKKGLHHIQVRVKDEDGREKTTSQPFALDGSKLYFDLLPRIALMSDASAVFRLMFFVLLAITILPLGLLRYLHSLAKVGKINKPIHKKNCVKLWIRKLWILSTVDRIFWPLIMYPIYLSFGPWSIGYLVEDNLGAIFAWGILINGTYLPGSFTYVYGFLHIPLTLVLANGVDHRFQYQVIKPGKTRTVLGNFFLHLPFVIILSVQLLMAYFFWLAYGTLAFLLGPLRTWSVVLGILLWHQALNLPEKCTREAAQIWSIKSETSLN